jgi:predicted ribosome quality control (RQC) complex YloA/Tae2 family protein
MKKTSLLIAVLSLSASGFSYGYTSMYKDYKLYPIGSKEWKQQQYEEEIEERQKKLEQRLKELEEELEESELYGY